MRNCFGTTLGEVDRSKFGGGEGVGVGGPAHFKANFGK